MTSTDPGTRDETDEPDQRVANNEAATVHDQTTRHNQGDISRSERWALELIRARGCLHQSELWKELDVSSRTGTRIARALADRGLIERTESTYQGRKTYLLSPDQPDAHAAEGAASGPRSTPTESDSGGEATPATADGVSVTETERRALALVSDRSPLPQSELCHLLGLSPENGEQLVRSLVDANRLQREETTLYGRRASLLAPADMESSS